MNARRAASPPRATIRWDRVGRLALLAVLACVLLLYVSPVNQYVTQSRTAASHHAELEEQRRDNVALKARVRQLRRPDALEREARELGMVRAGERAFVIRGAEPPR